MHVTMMSAHTSSSSQSLIEECRSRHPNLQRIQDLLQQQGADANACDEIGYCALRLEETNNHVNAVNLLLANGADVNLTDKHGFTPLLGVCSNGNMEIAKVLIAKGAEVDVVIPTMGYTPLHLAISGGYDDIAQLLIEEGNANVNLSSSAGETALHLASKWGDEKTAKLLIETGANHLARTTDKKQRLPIDLARENGHFNIVKLLEEASITEKNDASKNQAVDSIVNRQPIHQTLTTTAASTKNNHIFISYCRRDTTYARQLAQFLSKDYQFDVWIDENIEHGDQWVNEIDKAIRECGAFVVIMSADSSKSEWVQKEVLLAKRYHKKIMPILLNGLEFPILIDTQFEDVQTSLSSSRMHEVDEAVAAMPGPAFIRRLQVVISGKDGEIDHSSAPTSAERQSTVLQNDPYADKGTTTNMVDDRFTLWEDAIFDDDKEDDCLELHCAVKYSDKETIAEMVQSIRMSTPLTVTTSERCDDDSGPSAGKPNIFHKTDSRGRTALDLAALTGQVELVTLLKESGASFKKHNKSRMMSIAKKRSKDIEEYKKCIEDGL